MKTFALRVVGFAVGCSCRCLCSLRLSSSVMDDCVNAYIKSYLESIIAICVLSQHEKVLSDFLYKLHFIYGLDEFSQDLFDKRQSILIH